MKKMLIAVMMIVGVTGNAQALEFDINQNVLIQTVLTQVIKNVNGGQGTDIKVGNGGVTIHGAGVAGKGKMTKCWTSQIYSADGSVTTQLQCY